MQVMRPLDIAALRLTQFWFLQQVGAVDRRQSLSPLAVGDPLSAANRALNTLSQSAPTDSPSTIPRDGAIVVFDANAPAQLTCLSQYTDSTTRIPVLRDYKPPVVFIVGLSGAGKTWLGRCLEKTCGYFHVDADRSDGENGIDVFGLRHEWNNFLHRRRPGSLAAELRSRATAGGYAGTVLTLPSVLVFDEEQLRMLADIHIAVILAHAEPAHALRAFLKREQGNGRGLEESHWHRNNKRAAIAYANVHYDPLRLPMFNRRGRRRSERDLVADVMARTMGAPT
jgi:hypothetical protein